MSDSNITSGYRYYDTNTAKPNQADATDANNTLELLKGMTEGASPFKLPSLLDNFTFSKAQSQGEFTNTQASSMQQMMQLVSYVVMLVFGAMFQGVGNGNNVQLGGNGTNGTTGTNETSPANGVEQTDANDDKPLTSNEQRTQDWKTYKYDDQIKNSTTFDFKKYVTSQLDKKYLADHAEPKAPAKPSVPSKPSAPAKLKEPVKPEILVLVEQSNLPPDDAITRKAASEARAKLASMDPTGRARSYSQQEYDKAMTQYRTDKAAYDKAYDKYEDKMATYNSAVSKLNTYNKTTKPKFDKAHKAWADARTAYTNNADNQKNKSAEILANAQKSYADTGKLPVDLKTVVLKNA